MTSQRMCPICGKPVSEEYKPFCSKKCADIDLGRWLKGNYVIHTNERPKESDFQNENNEEK
ncbi:MAG: DNA gyrase inhibitor YacG [Alphaproteobacteria bacterium]|nr:DNA gyrase inhibitor YacG [Alphaproteobacteria bacterium]